MECTTCEKIWKISLFHSQYNWLQLNEHGKEQTHLMTELADYFFKMNYIIGFVIFIDQLWLILVHMSSAVWRPPHCSWFWCSWIWIRKLFMPEWCLQPWSCNVGTSHRAETLWQVRISCWSASPYQMFTLQIHLHWSITHIINAWSQLRFFFSLKNIYRSRPRGEQSLVRWAIPRLHDIDALSRMVDPSLDGAYLAKSLSRFADIISRCVQVFTFSPSS